MRAWYAMLALLSAKCRKSASLQHLTYLELSIILAFHSALMKLR